MKKIKVCFKEVLINQNPYIPIINKIKQNKMVQIKQPMDELTHFQEHIINLKLQDLIKIK